MSIILECYKLDDPLSLKNEDLNYSIDSFTSPKNLFTYVLSVLSLKIV